MKDRFKQFILNENFPCFMAKAVAKKGELSFNEYDTFDKSNIPNLLNKLYDFIDKFRENPEKLSSFIIVFKDPNYLDFDFFEKVFWEVLDSVETSSTTACF